MTDDDVPDSTDWLSTPLSGLSAVENALRCQVCKDFYKTPMLTTCSHTFCSLCIRRALANDGKCPLCRSSEQELKLRSNWSLEETVEAFVKARPATLQLARNARSSASASKRKAESESPQKGDAPEGKRVRTSARLRKNKVEQAIAEPIQNDEDEEVFEVPDTDGDDAYVPENDDGLVPCPVCQSRMKDWQVFKHLESCPGPTATKKKKKIGESSTFDRMQRQQAKPLERLPALNYSILREQALRKKLAELGISNQGPRNLLEKRHKEWITLWNANCDAARPKKRSELLHDLEIWEKTQGGRAPMISRAAQNATQVKDKEFDGAAWAAKHDSSFKDLIASARKSRMAAQKKAEEAGKPSTTKSSDKPAEGSKPGFSSEPRRDMLEATSHSYDNSLGNNNDGDHDDDPLLPEDMKQFYKEVEEQQRQKRMQQLSAPPKHDVDLSRTYGGSASSSTQLSHQGNPSQAGAAGNQPTSYDPYSGAYRVANPTPQEYIDKIHIYAVDNFPIAERPDSAFPQRSTASQPVVHSSETGDSGNLSTPSASLPNGTHNSVEGRPL